MKKESERDQFVSSSSSSGSQRLDSLVEPNSNLGQEPFRVLPTQPFPRSLPDLLQHVDASETRFGVDSFERDVVVLGFEVVLLLFRQKQSEPGEDT